MIVHIIHLYQRDDPDGAVPGVYGVVEDVAGATEYPFASSEDLWRILRRLLPGNRGQAWVRMQCNDGDNA